MPRSDSHTREAPPQVTHHALPLGDQLLHSAGGLPESSYRRMEHFGNLGETRRASRTLMHTPRDPRRGRGEGEAHRFGEPRKPRAFTFIPASYRALHPGEVALVFAQSAFGHGLVYIFPEEILRSQHESRRTRHKVSPRKAPTSPKWAYVVTGAEFVT